MSRSAISAAASAHGCDDTKSVVFSVVVALFCALLYFTQDLGELTERVYLSRLYHVTDVRRKVVNATSS